MRTITCIVFLGLMALAAGYVTLGDKVKYADKEFLEKQKTILEILQHVHQPEIHKKYYDHAMSWKFEDHYDMYKNADAVKEFVKFYETGMLHKNEIFTIMNEEHAHWAISLFHVFYYAKDWDTFYHSMVWARYHMNEGIFVYALTVAVLHRTDMVGMELPAPYELYPYYFYNTDVIQKAQTYKMQGFHGVKKAEGVYNVVIPSNYTSKYLYMAPDQKVSYFTEDIGLNTYYYYFHADYPFWMGGKEYGLDKDRRGELYLFQHQQFLARYYMERLSNDLGLIPEFSWYEPVTTGYYPNLRYYNGIYFPTRDNHHDYYHQENYFDISVLEEFEHRLWNLIDYGYLTLPDKSVVDFTKPESIEQFGNMVHGNPDSHFYRYFKYFEVYARNLLGGYHGEYDYTKVIPSVLEHYETAMRDPLFYMFYKRLMKNYYHFKNSLPYYKYEDLDFHGVKIESAEVDKLITYFDKYDSDITNSVDVEYKDSEKSDFIWSNYEGTDFVIKARQWRLNHLPFTVKLNVESEKSVKSVVRFYIGPKYDEFGNLYKINENRDNFWLLDSFRYDLKSGKNSIVRNSQDFTWFVKDRTPYYELYKWVMQAYKGETKFELDMTEAHCGFPDRLMLPKGKKGGMPFQFYFIVTPYVQPEIEQYSNYDYIINCGVGSGARHVDSLPFGYPFDREIKESEWYTPNMYYYDTMIYHKKETEVNASH